MPKATEYPTLTAADKLQITREVLQAAENARLELDRQEYRRSLNPDGLAGPGFPGGPGPQPAPTPPTYEEQAAELDARVAELKKKVEAAEKAVEAENPEAAPSEKE